MLTHAQDSSNTGLERTCVPAKIEVKLLLDEVLAATVELQKADLGCVHWCNPSTRRPEMMAHRALSPELIDLSRDDDDEQTIWNRALSQGRRILVEDVRADASFAAYRAFQATPLFGRGGERLGVISTFFREPHRRTDQELRFSDLHARLAVEVIERQRAEEALRDSEARYHWVLRNLPAAVYTCDATGRVTLFNDAAVALWGRTPDLERDEWSGSYKMYHPDGRPLPLDLYPMAISLKEGRALSSEAIVERPDGTRRRVRAYPQPIRDTSGSLAGAVNMVLDITDYKNTQEALRKSEDRFRRYFELGLIGMATMSPDKGVLEVNDELCRILGYERAELLQKTWAELTHPDDLAADVANSSARSQRNSVRRAVPLKTDLYALHAAHIIERERNGAVLLHYQQELRALTARLIDLQETQNRYLARELHDTFSQKLAVLGIEMAALAQGPPESFDTISARLRRFTEQIGDLSKDIHQISRQLHPAILDDLGLEAALKNECLIFAKQHGIPTEFDPAGIPCNIPDDVALCLYRVAQECLRNVARHANAASVRVTLRACHNEIALEIVDNGDGFDPEKVKSRGRLGLISVDERCRLVNGKFSVHSEPGMGTRVNVRVALEES